MNTQKLFSSLVNKYNLQGYTQTGRFVLFGSDKTKDVFGWYYAGLAGGLTLADKLAVIR